MLVDFKIPTLYDMKFIDWKNHLVGQISYRSPEPSKNGVIALRRFLGSRLLYKIIDEIIF